MYKRRIGRVQQSLPLLFQVHRLASCTSEEAVLELAVEFFRTVRVSPREINHFTGSMPCSSEAAAVSRVFELDRIQKRIKALLGEMTKPWHLIDLFPSCASLI